MGFRELAACFIVMSICCCWGTNKSEDWRIEVIPGNIFTSFIFKDHFQKLLNLLSLSSFHSYLNFFVGKSDRSLGDWNGRIVFLFVGWLSKHDKVQCFSCMYHWFFWFQIARCCRDWCRGGAHHHNYHSADQLLTRSIWGGMWTETKSAFDFFHPPDPHCLV